MNSSNLYVELMNVIIDAVTAHLSMSRQALNSEALRARMLATIPWGQANSGAVGVNNPAASDARIDLYEDASGRPLRRLGSQG